MSNDTKKNAVMESFEKLLRKLSLVPKQELKTEQKKYERAKKARKRKKQGRKKR